MDLVRLFVVFSMRLGTKSDRYHLTLYKVNSFSVKYSTFDILQDEEVRQGLKKYSDWPSYPQLYIKGELIGGLDIVKVNKNIR